VHIAPGAVLAGNISVGENSFIGANSVVRQGVKIGSGVILGAGSVVIKNIPDNEIWAGNPAKKLNR
jgi:acetyltransferase-like isoleucine patch superfamily enzyme